MKRLLLAVVWLSVFLLPVPALCQSSNASLSGTVTDSSDAILPGVSVTATNVATDVVNTTISNKSGVYNFPSLLPGTYTVAAELTDFQPYTYKDVKLGNAAQVRLNFQLQVGGVVTTVEVNVEADNILLESSSSTGEVLSENSVEALPQVNSNALDMVKVMSSYIPYNGNTVFFADNTTINGVSVGNLNIQRDGVQVNDVRFPTGVHAPTQINTDMVGELRLVQSPVDAEMGHGNSQIQILTKSGTNEFHGSLVWDFQNAGLDSNQWENNRSGVVPPWRNLHQYTISVGGPIIKNKTFFFALFNGQIARLRDSQNPLVLTNCARKGIFRYYDNWNNGRFGAATVSTGQVPTTAVVDFNGNPVIPATNPDGSDYTGALHLESVLGELTDTARNQLLEDPIDCSAYDFSAANHGLVDDSAWDPYRNGVDPTGYIDTFLSRMPDATSFESIGDGLNTAGGRWTRTTAGADNMYGIGEDNNRKQFNLKIDHNFNENHRISGSWSFEKGWADNNYPVWPKGYGGRTERQPQVLTLNFNSVFRSNFFNEILFGMSRTGTNGYQAMESPASRDAMLELLPQASGLPVIVSPGTQGAFFSVASSNIHGGRGALLGWSNQDTSPRWTFGDTLSWVKGKHTIKGGGTFYISGSKSSVWGTGWGYNTTPYAVGGNPSGLPVEGVDSTNLTGLTGNNNGNQLLAQNLLTFLAGSLQAIQQSRFINSTDDLESWNDPLTDPVKIRNMRKKEFAFFIKDDWKLTPELTLNLGLRYEYYGVPYLKNGLTAGLVGGGDALYGISGRNWSDAFWYYGPAREDLTELTFIGPGSEIPDQRIYKRDWNNFGPAVGFAWQVPWFGKGKTTLRGGYQLTYQDGDNLATVEGIIANPPGSAINAQYAASDTYLNLENMGDYIPVAPNAAPMLPIPVTDRSQTITVYDPDLVTPYIQNLTLSLTRSIGSKLTLDVRYIGTLSRKNVNNININIPNFLTNGLLEAFNVARYGWESNPEYAESAQLLDDIFAPVRGATSGAQYLRTLTRGSFGVQGRRMLANGDYQSLANLIDQWSNPSDARERGWLLREAGFSENFIVTNPQFNTVNLRTNRGTSNYHSMQVQLRMRPTTGISFQTSYTWSKNLGNLGGTPTDPRNIGWDYGLLNSDRRHTLNSYGTVELPLGPNRLFFSESSGVLARFLENWRMSWILNVSSGSPLDITAQNTLYGTGVPDLVGDFPFDSVGVYWENGAYRGNYFADLLTENTDPQCALLESGLQAQCTLKAVFDTEGNVILQNPEPGKLGSFGKARIFSPATWSLDMAMGKTVQIDETKSVEFRVDASNIFNHPQPGGSVGTSSTRLSFANPPDVNMNNAALFGDLGSKVGNRTFQGRLRINF